MQRTTVISYYWHIRLRLFVKIVFVAQAEVETQCLFMVWGYSYLQKRDQATLSALDFKSFSQLGFQGAQALPYHI